MPTDRRLVDRGIDHSCHLSTRALRARHFGALRRSARSGSKDDVRSRPHATHQWM